MLQLKSPYQDGTTRIVPREFMQRFAALVPRPRLHLIRFHGVLAPTTRLRPEIVPVGAVNVNVSSEHSRCIPSLGAGPSELGRLLKWVFDIDMEHCPCGGTLKCVPRHPLPGSG
ncbi:MAG: transposase [Gammaproteobacteria bacterium]